MFAFPPIIDVKIDLLPLSAVASLRNSAEPRSLNRFQQLNAVKMGKNSFQSL